MTEIRVDEYSYPKSARSAKDRKYRVSSPERDKNYRVRNRAAIKARRSVPVRIAVLDLETDPFDNSSSDYVRPFLGVVYSDDFVPIVMWNEDHKTLAETIVATIEALPDKYIIYAHNGGRFDYMHIIHLLRGSISFKGRGIMRASIGKHELRDSLHIIPEALKNANQKDEIDYSTFKKDKRSLPHNKQNIIQYCINDCKYTFDIVKAFVDRFGTPLTIGQAAMKELKKHYTFECLSDRTDMFMRDWFHGGRVECLKQGAFYEPFILIDKNSMYPFCMAYYQHPIGNEFYCGRVVTSRTVFITLTCRNPKGAFVVHAEDGSLSTYQKSGVFRTTIWEYNVARKLNLISDVEILQTVDFYKFSDFSKFVLPLYAARETAKKEMDLADDAQKLTLEKDVKFYKYLLNNAYGKFAQNPRRFKDHFLTDPNERPLCPEPVRNVEGDFSRILDMSYGTRPEVEGDGYWIWSKEAPEFRFNNVATGASITGAARAELLEAIHNVDAPLYCDTDSIVCRGTGDLELDRYNLGGWKVEANIEQFISAGKKLYAYRKPGWQDDPKKTIVKVKGANNVSWDEMLKVVNGETISKTLIAPTFNKSGSQHYLTRELRRTFDYLHSPT